ncbi:MAG: lysozyme inhibitor LprI family protein [Candidatus Binatia bacterium]
MVDGVGRGRVVVGFLVASLFGVAVPCRASYGRLPSDVQTVIHEEYGAPDAAIRYRAGAVDLDDDGRDELLVHVVGSMACGSGGCPTLVFTPAGSRYRLVSTIAVTRTPIGVSTTTTEGWRNLIVRVSGGGTRARDVELLFDGTSYPANPTVPGTRVKTTSGQHARVVIEEMRAFEDATLLPNPADAPAVAAPAKRAPSATRPASDPPKAATAATPPAASGKPGAAAVAAPSFDCTQASAPVEKLICGDGTLAALDRALDAAYVDAMRRSSDDVKTGMRAQQRTWIGKRNSCAGTRDAKGCVAAAYQRRLGELKAHDAPSGEDGHEGY